MNRSYLFSLDFHPDGLKPHAIGLSESEADIPLIYRILLSQNPRVTQSILFSGNWKIAITADYEAGVEELSIFFAMLPEEYQEKAGKVISFLRSEKNAQKLIHLECAEIFEMADGDLEEQNAALLAELSDIDMQIADALNDIEHGDVSDLYILDEEYWSNVLAVMPSEVENAAGGDSIFDIALGGVLPSYTDYLGKGADYEVRGPREADELGKKHGWTETCTVRCGADETVFRIKYVKKDAWAIDTVEIAQPTDELFLGRYIGKPKEDVLHDFPHGVNDRGFVVSYESEEFLISFSIKDERVNWIYILSKEKNADAVLPQKDGATRSFWYTPAPGETPEEIVRNIRKQLEAAKADEMLGAIFAGSGEAISGSTDSAKQADTLNKSDLLRDYDNIDEADEADDLDDNDESEVPDFDPKNPGGRYKNRTVKMAEPELYRKRDTGEKFGGFILREGEITGLPIAPENMYAFNNDDNEDEELPDWRLFLRDGEGNECVLDYHRAIHALQFLAEYGEKYLIGEKDGYVVTTPLTREELRTLANVVSAAEDDSSVRLRSPTESEDEQTESEEEADSDDETDESETVYLNPADDPNADRKSVV